MKKNKFCLYILLFFFIFLSFSFVVDAAISSNFNSNYTINFSSDFFTSQQKQFYQDIIDLNSDYYNLIITYNKSQYSTYNYSTFHLIPKNVSSINVSAGGIKYNTSQFFYKIYGSYKYYSVSSFDSSSSSYSSFYNCFINNVCQDYSTNSDTTLNISFTLSDILDNSSSFAIPYTDYTANSGLIYYSDVNLNFVNTYNSSSGSTYYKNLIFNGINYTVNDYLPTFYSIFNVSPSISQLNNFTDLNDIFISNIPTSNISTFQFDFRYIYNSLYSNNLTDFSVLYYGRIDNSSNYFSYEELTCTSSFTFSIDESNKLIIGRLKNISCSNLSNYDEIYIRIRPYTSFPVSMLILDSNYGYPSVIPISNGANYYSIKEHFTNLSSHYSILLSTTHLYSYVFIKSSSNKSFVSSYYHTSSSLSSTATYNLTYGQFDSSSALIYNYYPGYSDVTDIDIYFSDDSILSIGSLSGDFYYIDSSGNISPITIVNQYLINILSQTTDDIFSKINDFIDSLEDDLNDFHSILQYCFSALDPFLQLTIQVLYSIFLIYILFLIITS